MKERIYLKLNNYIHSKYTTLCLTTIIVFLMNILFLISLIFRKRKCIAITPEAAKIKLKSIHNNELIMKNSDRIPFDNCLLSFIVPTYNSEKTIERCINSIIENNFKFRFEIIIINDGSKDKTEEILEKFKHFQYIKIISQINQGISAARNKGIELCEGRYLTFVDSDDTINANGISELVLFAEKNNLDIVEGNYNRLFNGDKKVSSPFRGKKVIFSQEQLDKNIKNIKGYPWGKIYKRDLWNDVCFPVGLDFEDTIIKLLVFKKSNNYGYLPVITYNYYIHEFSITNRLYNSLKCLDYYYILEYIINQNEKLNLKWNKYYYSELLNHFGFLLYDRTKNLEPDIQNIVFVLGRELLQSVKKYDSSILSIKNYLLKKSITNLDIEMWRICCKYS